MGHILGTFLRAYIYTAYMCTIYYPLAGPSAQTAKRCTHNGPQVPKPPSIRVFKQTPIRGPDPNPDRKHQESIRGCGAGSGQQISKHINILE